MRSVAIKEDHSISLSGLTISYGTSFTLGPVHCTLEPGTVTALVGPNGSGKSTLFRTMMKYSFPDQGHVRFWGQQYPENEVEIKRRLAYVPEISDLDHHGRHLKDLASFMSYWYPSWDDNNYRRLLESFEINENMPFKKMSKGSHRKASLILALSHNPDLLLLDEPSSGLDPFAIRKMIEEINRFMDEPNRMVLMATHSMEEVRRLADFVLFMHHGKQIGFYEKDELVDEWRSVWIEENGGDPSEWPGVQVVENSGGPLRIITNQYIELESYLDARSILPLKVERLELEEVLLYLLQQHKQS